MTVRVNIDTSVVGGCRDAEFADALGAIERKLDKETMNHETQ